MPHFINCYVVGCIEGALTPVIDFLGAQVKCSLIRALDRCKSLQTKEFVSTLKSQVEWARRPANARRRCNPPRKEMQATTVESVQCKQGRPRTLPELLCQTSTVTVMLRLHHALSTTYKKSTRGESRTSIAPPRGLSSLT